MISEHLQQPGSFSITLRTGTPLDIRKAVPYEVGGLPFGHMAVTATRLTPQTLTRSAILGNAIWTGRISARSNQMHTFEGNGIAVWLGDADNKCDVVTGYGGGGPATFTNAATAVLSTVPNGNGITLGDTSLDSGGTATTSFHNVTPIDLFNEYAANTGNAWRVNPDGTFDLGAPSSLFVDPPRVVILRDEGGPDGTYDGIPAAELEIDEDFDDYATYAFVTGDGATGSNSVGSPPKNFGGSTSAVIEVGINSSASTTAACNTAGTNYLNLHKPSRRQVQCSVRFDNIHAVAEPGDRIYLFDPETDLIDGGNQIVYRGRVLSPASAQLLGYQWPLISGMGLYTIASQDGSDAIVDLSDWFQPESGLTTLEVGSPRRPQAQPVLTKWGKS